MVEQDDGITCPRCGQARAAGAVSCDGCGAPFGGADRSDSEKSGSGAAGSEPTVGAGTAAADATIVASRDSGGDRSAPSGHDPTLVGDPSGQATEVAGAGSALAAGQALTPGQKLGTRYEILAVLGEGGFGAVYKAHDEVLDRTVALKVIRPQLAADPEILERFKRESLLASKITHKNVVRIHDLGEIGDLKFISMNFVEGTDLKSLIVSEGRLTVERALPIVRQVAEALQAAHEAGVVHRDLKPHNVLLDKEGNAYIADFGISRSVESGGTMTEAGAVLGTVSYMSPEQARGEVPDHRSDIYSLGLMIYEMLTGALPFQAANPLSSLMKRVNEDAPSIDTVHSNIPLWIARIVARSMERDLDARYQSVSELMTDLDRQRATRAKRRLLGARAGKIAAALVLVLVVAWAAQTWWRNRAPAAPPEVEASLILLPFRNATGDAGYDWIRAGVPDLLRSELRQSKALNLIGEARVREYLDTLNLGQADDIQPASLQRISNLIGVENVVAGTLFKLGRKYRIEARLLRIGRSSIVDETEFRVEGDGEDALFGMVDELAGRVRKELGLSRSRGERRRKVTELSTSSIDALRRYNLGGDLVRQGRDVEAENELRAALDADPEFGMARAMLAEAYERLGKIDEAIAEADLATAGLGDASTYEAARIRAVRARLDDDMDAALTAYEELTDLAPNNPEAFHALALAQEDAGRLEPAELSLARVLELDSKNPGARYARGRVLAKQGRPSEALQEFNTALGLHGDAGNDEGRARVLIGLGNTHRILGDPEKALTNFEESLALARSAGNQRGVGAAQNNIATIFLDLGRYEEAVEFQQASISTYRELGDMSRMADSTLNLGDIYDVAGRSEDAVAAYEDALATLRDVGDDTALARTFVSLGYVYMLQGDYTKAFFSMKNALEKRRELHDTNSVIESLIYVGAVEQVQGRYDQALGYYGEALDKLQTVRNEQAQVAVKSNLAAIHEEQGAYGSALAAAEEALQMAEGLEDPRLTSVGLVDLGGVRLSIGDLDSARETLARAAVTAGEAGHAEASARVMMRQAELLLLEGKREQAVTTARSALEVAAATMDYRLSLLARLAVARVTGSRRELAEIVAEAESKKLEPVVAWARLSLARAHLESADFPRAWSEAEATVELAASLHQQDTLMQAHHVAAAAARAQGKPSVAAEHVLSGLDPLAAVLGGLDVNNRRYFLRRPKTTEFSGLARDVLEKAGHAGELTRLEELLVEG